MRNRLMPVIYWLTLTLLLGNCFAFGFIDRSNSVVFPPKIFSCRRNPTTTTHLDAHPSEGKRIYNNEFNRTRINKPHDNSHKQQRKTKNKRSNGIHHQKQKIDFPPKERKRRQLTRKASNNPSLSSSPFPREGSNVWKKVSKIRSPHELEIFVRQQGGNSSSCFDDWSVAEQVSFVKLLQSKGAHKATLYFLDSLSRPNVKVCTTAMFSMALSSIDRHEALGILDLMDRRGVLPTSLTFIALLGSVDGPAATTYMMSRFEKYKNVKITSEVYNSAIYACRRVDTTCDSSSAVSQQQQHQSSNDDWQVSMRLLQQMRSRGIHPTIKTFHAMLQVLARTGKVTIAMSLLRQIKNTPGLEPDDSIWAAAINVCAQASDFRMAIQLINDMQQYDGGSRNYQPNLRHCSALIKSFAKCKQDQLAILALEMMIGQKSSTSIQECGTMMEGQQQYHQISNPAPPFQLPQIPPDLIALNTVIAACAKAKNYEAAISIYHRIKAGEFRDPHNNHKLISPDLITHHHLLVSCHDPMDAVQIVKEMRLSRRYRYGVCVPNHATYVHAINVCQRAENPDLASVDLLLRWANTDGITPNVYMLSSAIWTAQRCGNWKKALYYFQEMDIIGCDTNAVAYNGVLSAMCVSGDIYRTLDVYRDMKHNGYKINGATVKRLADIFSSVHDLGEKQIVFEELLDLMTFEERSINISGPIFEALITIYGSQGLVDKAISTFESINGLVDKSCLRSVLLACALSNPVRWEDAISILHTSDIVEAVGPGKMDQLALSNAILACCRADQFEEGLNLLQLYGLPKSERQGKTLPSIPVVAMNALISACGRGKRPDLSLATFNDMQSKFGISPDVRSYRSAIIACNQAEHESRRKGQSELQRHDFDGSVKWWECALALLRRMQEEDLSPDIFIFSSVISACEAAGEWQRALGVLQILLDENDSEDGERGVTLNLYCFNAAISACEKGGAWIEALELYERMLDRGGSIKPNFITLSSLIVALEKAGQKELAEGKYIEGLELGIFNPFRWTVSKNGSRVRALDLHRFSAAMAKVALRNVMDSYLLPNTKTEISPDQDLVIITGRGRNSVYDPILKSTTLELLWNQYEVEGKLNPSNPGRVNVDSNTLLEFIASKSWVGIMVQKHLNEIE